jgi:hypothetical protein
VLCKTIREVQRFAPVLMSTPLPKPAVSGGCPHWLMLRSHQVNATSCFVFAVSDGRGGGHVTLLPALPAGSPLRIAAVTIESEEEGQAPAPVTVGADGLSFSGHVEVMAMVAFHVRLAP